MTSTRAPLVLALLLPTSALAVDDCPVDGPPAVCGTHVAGSAPAPHRAASTDDVWSGVYGGACAQVDDFALPGSARTFVCPPGGTVVTVDVAPDGCDVDLFVLSGCAGDTCLAGSTSADGSAERVSIACTGGEALYLSVERADAGDADPSGTCPAIDDRDFELSVGCDELCGDGFDNDLDGLVDELDPDCAPVDTDVADTDLADTDVVTFEDGPAETDAAEDADTQVHDAEPLQQATASGCGCDVPAARWSLAPVLAVLGLVRRRRRAR